MRPNRIALRDVRQMGSGHADILWAFWSALEMQPVAYENQLARKRAYPACR